MPQRLLSLETSGQTGGVAVFEDGRLLLERPLAAGQRSAQSLSPAIRDLLIELNFRPADIGAVAVTVGPGSFTGLRIGVTTAKTFAYAVGAEVIGVNTLETIAQAATTPAERLWTVIDAQRGELYAARFVRDTNGHWQTDIPTAICDRQRWLSELKMGESVSGPALAGILDKLAAGVGAVSDDLWLPTAANVGRLAVRKLSLGCRDDGWNLAPQYYRRSAAEEKWDQQHQSGT